MKSLPKNPLQKFLQKNQMWVEILKFNKSNHQETIKNTIAQSKKLQSLKRKILMLCFKKN